MLFINFTEDDPIRVESALK